MYKAEIIQASKYNNFNIYTLDICFPRTALAEFLTHRTMSKNTASTRAIPVKAHTAFVRENPYIPDWTKDQAGMQGGELDKELADNATDALMVLLDQVCDTVEYLGGSDSLGNLGIHKQDAGRYLEPFSYITLRVTSTQWKNFFWLRDDEAAYPPIARIAKLIKEAIQACEPMVLNEGEYHVPGVDRKRDIYTDELCYFSPEGHELTKEDAIELSMSLCAQQSFRKTDSSDKKTESVINKLFKGNKVHASPSEHQATPIGDFKGNYLDPVNWPIGVTHMGRDCELWSGNFKGWIQHRQLLQNHDAELIYEPIN